MYVCMYLLMYYTECAMYACMYLCMYYTQWKCAMHVYTHVRTILSGRVLCAYVACCVGVSKGKVCVHLGCTHTSR